MNKILIFALICAAFSSCATKRQILYFQDAEKLDMKEIETSFNPIIEPNDILYVTVSSLNEEAVAPFVRNTGASAGSGGGSSNLNLRGYLVNPEGEIRFPVLGDIAVMGKTRQAIEKELKAKLSEYITDVVIDVRIINFKVTVLGAVNSPGVFPIQDERVTLPEVIALAGDIAEDGNRNDITVIREVDGIRKVAKIDFRSTDLFSSPYYFLKQNDIVYVEPSLKRVKESGFIPNYTSLISLFTLILTTTILLTR